MGVIDGIYNAVYAATIAENENKQGFLREGKADGLISYIFLIKPFFN